MTTKSVPYLQSLGRLLGATSAGCTKLSNRMLQSQQLTIQQWIPLTALWRKSPIPESELAEYCQSSTPSLNRLLDRMERKGLITRSKDSCDRRRTLVALGTKGKSVSHLIDLYLNVNTVLTKGFSKQETAQLASLLQRVLDNIKSHNESQ